MDSEHNGAVDLPSNAPFGCPPLAFSRTPAAVETSVAGWNGHPNCAPVAPQLGCGCSGSANLNFYIKYLLMDETGTFSKTLDRCG